jgi:serine/threonine protein kinase
MRLDQWPRARTILELAASRPPGERVRCISECCPDDQQLRTEIESLLGQYGETAELEALLRSAVPPGLHTTVVGTVGAADAPFPVGDPEASTRTERSEKDARTWGDFVLLDELGRGGFGVVHRAWDPDLKRELALKLIDARRLGGTAGDRLLYEGQLLARVNHAHVVRVISAKRIGGEVGLAMELINGRTLWNLVAEQGSLNAPEAALVGISLCDALAAVHHVGLVHRDLKASNVMREHGGRIVLMDFGAGREQATASGRSLEIVGTPTYTAPEVLFGAEATPSSDLYSLGVLLFYLVTGRHPVQGRGFDQVREAHQRGVQISLEECRLDLPARFIKVVERALSPDPNERYRTPQQFKHALSDAMPGLTHDEETERGLRPDLPPAHSLLHRLATWSAAGIAVLVLCLGLGIVTTNHFDWVLVRHEPFGSATFTEFLKFGFATLVPPLQQAVMLTLLWVVVGLVVRLFGVLVPALPRQLSWLRAGLKTRLRKAELDDPSTLAQTICVVGLAAVAIHIWWFLPFISALTKTVDAGAIGDLALLSRRDHIWTHYSYGVALVVVGIGLLMGLRLVRRAAISARQPLPAVPMAGIVLLIVICLFLVAAPWRLLWRMSDQEFSVATFRGQRCFIIREIKADAGGVLLNCPGNPPPRNQVVKPDDPELVRSSTQERLFAAYADLLSR